MNVKFSGLKCDADCCDYSDPDIKVEDYHLYVDESCPDCGENLLTQADFDAVQALLDTVSIIEHNKIDDSKDTQVSVYLNLNGTGEIKHSDMFVSEDKNNNSQTVGTPENAPDYLQNIDTKIPTTATVDEILKNYSTWSGNDIYSGATVATLDFEHGLSLDIEYGYTDNTPSGAREDYLTTALYRQDGGGDFVYTRDTFQSIVEVINDLQRTTLEELVEETFSIPLEDVILDIELTKKVKAIREENKKAREENAEHNAEHKSGNDNGVKL